MSMSSMSISSSSIRIRSGLKMIDTPSSFPKPSFLFFPHSFTSSKSISFQKLPTKPHHHRILSSSSSLQPIEELPPKLQQITKLFQSVDDPRAKFQQLLFYASNLPPLDEKYKTKENKVEGCVSQVWVRAFLDDNSKDIVYYEADSDSVMTKGLAALLVLGLSGQPVSEIVKVQPDFVTLLGLQQTLSPSRNNGFLNMLRLMKFKALWLGMEAEKGENSSSVESSVDDNGGIEKGSDDWNENVVIGSVNGENRSSVESGGDDNGGIEEGSDDRNENVVTSGVSGENSSSVELGGNENGGRKERIKEVLEKELKPVELEIEDVSYQHAGHGGVKGSDGETHYNLKVVSNEFEGKSLVKRHRIIYGLLQDELQAGLHALSITAKTPTEVEQGR